MFALALMVLGFAMQASLALAATTERIIADRHTGLALYGYDPVAYFTDGKPLQGRPELEYSLAGVIWRFRNEGNRQAFIGHTEVYMPHYGGYDPIAVARGVAKPGHPEFWLLDHDRLYLFADGPSRTAFAANPAGAIAAAEAKWPAVRNGLSP